MTNRIRFSHVGICVRDMVESITFYTEALGFAVIECYRMGDNVAALSEVMAPIALQAQFLRKEHTVIELLRWELPGTEGDPERRPMNQLGLTHLAVAVADVDDAIDRITRFGGTVHPHTRVTIPEGDHVFCTDPNGVRIEVIRTADAGWYDRLHGLRRGWQHGSRCRFRIRLRGGTVGGCRHELLKRRKRTRPVHQGRATAHGDSNADRLGNFVGARAATSSATSMRGDAAIALLAYRDSERDQLLGLGVKRTGRERSGSELRMPTVDVWDCVAQRLLWLAQFILNRLAVVHGRVRDPRATRRSTCVCSAVA